MTLVLFGLSLYLTRTARAVPPIPPLKPAISAHWTITYQDRTSASAATPTPKPAEAAQYDTEAGTSKDLHILKEEYEIGDKIAYVLRSYSNGSNDHLYMVKGVAFISDAITQSVRAETLSPFSDKFMRFAEKYPGFDWVKKENFIDEQEINNRKYLHFRQGSVAAKPATPSDDGASLFYDPAVSPKEREAWIDEETHLPLSFRQGTLVGVYRHLPPTAEKITLPPDIVKAQRIYDGYND